MTAHDTEIIEPSDMARARTLANVWPIVQRYKSLLHVGEQLRSGWKFWPDTFKSYGIETMDVLEIWRPNAEALRGMPLWRHVYHANVLQADEVAVDPVDIVFWWHGPEHLQREQFDTAIDALIKGFMPKLIILGLPWGRHDNWEHKFKNVASYHRSIWYPDDLKKMGYQVATEGTENHGHISAWREVGCVD